MTFNQFCQKYEVKGQDREELIWHLIMLRVRRMYKQLAQIF